ncbi:MAG: methyltransferase domain-containing protein [Proteobacteria bacterium]|nr:methyltransferase domain-containing protein [Pseudomonadota bacterium]MBU1612649.1 methyltransferase domain-containing protein [Pseudomonadota bacterium]
MTWDAEKYENWFASDRGQAALFSERRLLDLMVAGWPRRGTKLLEVGCGTGLFLESLWQMGFDVTGVDLSPGMVKAARSRFGNRAEISVGNGECLPFSSGEFDYVVLWTVLEFCADPGAMLREAARIAEQGVLVGFLNRWSFYYHSHGNAPQKTLGQGRWYSWPQMKRMISVNVERAPETARSVLPGPVTTWRNDQPYRFINSRCIPPWFGAFTAARVDFKNERPLTPIAIFPEAG